MLSLTRDIQVFIYVIFELFFSFHIITDKIQITIKQVGLIRFAPFLDRICKKSQILRKLLFFNNMIHIKTT